MGNMRINFSEIENSFEPIPEGTYEAIIETVQVRDSRSSDNNYLNWEFRIMDEEFEDRRVWNITSLAPKALFRLKGDLVSLGVIEEDDEIDLEWDDSIDIQQKEGPELIFPEVIGMPCRVTVFHETYNGNIQNRVSAVEASGGDVVAASTKSRSGPRSNNVKSGRARRLR